MDGFYAASVFAIGECPSLSANFSLPCVPYALLTKLCFWSWLQRDVALYLNAVVRLDIWNNVDAGADKERRSLFPCVRSGICFVLIRNNIVMVVSNVTSTRFHTYIYILS